MGPLLKAPHIYGSRYVPVGPESRIVDIGGKTVVHPLNIDHRSGNSAAIHHKGFDISGKLASLTPSYLWTTQVLCQTLMVLV
jgi:hypothetical protein